MSFEAIPRSHFVEETFQKCEFVVNGENPIWEPQELMAKLRVVFNLRTKTFSY